MAAAPSVDATPAAVGQPSAETGYSLAEAGSVA
ncbi:hypothetical protein PDESU_06542 [Pontiella desulfatans]|uniref:Uncharacterized protein n=1 Tax=Pontiella desulfatans TaxID=2750659 RepID=A0A6C2UCS5_PONDE|nr:hypothetical protein PDESU_06542 [Pontiella desulfatans]